MVKRCGLNVDDVASYSDIDIPELAESVYTVDTLASYAARRDEESVRILPKEKRRYVMYLRKSTEDEDRQIRSIEDQKIECLEKAKMIGVTVAEQDIFEESKSAKKSGNRPIFDDMVLGFKKRKYHGLIAWSPDRLSRNMKEAGELIEMIDEELIQDLHFRTYDFDNSPNGKMLLGILFATSKQYSDKLSDDVNRGNKGKIREGKYNGVIKKGYYADKDTWEFKPDGVNWALLRKAFLMRLDGSTNQEIAGFLNASKFSQRKTNDDLPKVVKMNNKKVGDIFADWFYCGVYKYGNNIANLVDLYGFMPVVTPDEFIKINKSLSADFAEKTISSTKKANRIEYGLLRGKVICDYCGIAMQFMNPPIRRGKNAGKRMITFSCRNTECQRFKTAENKANGIKLAKSIRARYVVAAIEYVLEHCRNITDEAYEMYCEKLKTENALQIAVAKRTLTEAKNDLKKHQANYSKYKKLQLESPDQYKAHHSGELERQAELIQSANEIVEVSKARLQKLNDNIPTREDLRKLIDSYLLTLQKTTSIVEQDIVCSELVANLRAGNDSVSVIKLNPPYSLMVDFSENSSWSG